MKIENMDEMDIGALNALTEMRLEINRLEAENATLRTANCSNCRYDTGDDTCSNPVDQCGIGDRTMWEAAG